MKQAELSCVHMQAAASWSYLLRAPLQALPFSGAMQKSAMQDPSWHAARNRGTLRKGATTDKGSPSNSPGGACQRSRHLRGVTQSAPLPAQQQSLSSTWSAHGLTSSSTPFQQALLVEITHVATQLMCSWPKTTTANSCKFDQLRGTVCRRC